MPLALNTYGQFKERAEHPSNAGFHELNDPIFAVADQLPGLVARSGYASDEGPQPWGEEAYPRSHVERGDGWAPATLSLWAELEAVFGFVYFWLHAQALKRGHEWFQKGDWPPLTLWWHEGAGHPTWSDAVERHHHLQDNGATAYAFTFKEPFDREGQPTQIDSRRIKEMREALG